MTGHAEGMHKRRNRQWHPAKSHTSLSREKRQGAKHGIESAAVGHMTVCNCRDGVPSTGQMFNHGFLFISKLILFRIV